MEKRSMWSFRFSTASLVLIPAAVGINYIGKLFAGSVKTAAVAGCHRDDPGQYVGRTGHRGDFRGGEQCDLWVDHGSDFLCIRNHQSLYRA